MRWRCTPLKITNRLYAYPVLSEDKDDYVNSEFKVSMTHDQSITHLILHFSITMDNEDIDRLIGSGQAEYMIHAECSGTSFRTVQRSARKEFDLALPLDKINGTVELVAFIVCSRDIKDFSSSDWNSDFEGFRFSLDKGSVLAYQNLPNLEITKNVEQLVKQDSIFTVFKRAGDDGNGMTVNMQKDRIHIGLPEESYKIFASCIGKAKLRPILNSLVVLPALVYVIEELCQDRSEDDMEKHDYTVYTWYKSMERSFRGREQDFMEFVEDNRKTSLAKAQELMGMPVGKSLIAIRNFLEDLDSEVEP